jgi:hypothetical protein
MIAARTKAQIKDNLGCLDFELNTAQNPMFFVSETTPVVLIHLKAVVSVLYARYS